MPLTFAQMNTQYIITKITGQDKVRTHLRDLGFVENETVSVIQSIQGNLIVEIKGIRVALDKSLANRIMI